MLPICLEAPYFYPATNPSRSVHKNIQPVSTQTFTPEGARQRADALAVEEPLEIRIAYGAGARRKRLSVAVTMRTPGDDEDLVLGFLFTEGIVQDPKQVLAFKWLEENTLLVELHPAAPVEVERLTRHLFTSSSCGVCGKASLDALQSVCCYFPVAGAPQVPAEVLYRLPDKLLEAQSTFESTGGLHAGGLFDTAGRLVLLREDIGRHNAVDKVIGAALRSAYPLPLRDYLLLVSGRAGFELVQKAAMAGLPLLAAVGAPSSLALELAAGSGMTLIGFLRGERFNVYTGAERIKPV